MMSVTISDTNDVRFVFVCICLQEGSCLIYVICDCLHIVVSKTYCVCVFCYCVNFRLVCTMLPVSLDCPFLIDPSVFSNLYILNS